MRKMFPVLLVLFTAAAQAAPPSLDIPAEVKPSGQYVTIEPKTDADGVAYVGLSGVDPLPSALLKNPKTFILDTRGMRDGKYTFTAVGWKGAEYTRVTFTVLVGDGPQPPPDPEPNPEPMEVTKFVRDLKAALAADPANERGLVPKLIEFYDYAAKEVDVQENWEALYLQLKTKATDLGTLGKMHNVAVVISEKLKKVLPTGTDLNLRPITPAERTAAKKTFAEVRSALKKV